MHELYSQLDTCLDRLLTHVVSVLLLVSCNIIQMAAVLVGAEDMSMGNFVAECANKSHVRYLAMARPDYGRQGPTIAHPDSPRKSAPLKEPHMFERYYHLRNLVVRTEVLQRQQLQNIEDRTNPKIAVCVDTSLFGTDINFFDVIEWVAYQRLLGFDQVFMTYIEKDCHDQPGFQELLRLPYLTIAENFNSFENNATQDDAILGVRKGSLVLAGACDRLCIIQRCLKTTAWENYDWVWFASVGQYLWFNQNMGVKDFVSQHGKYHDMLSFGRYIYSPKHREGHDDDRRGAVAEPISGFWAEDYPFTAKTYCEKRTVSGQIPDPCPMWLGRSKVMIRPSVYQGPFFFLGLFNKAHKIKIHGNVFEEMSNGQFQAQAGERAMHLPMDIAHMKQWSVNTRTVGPSTMMDKGKELVITPKDESVLDGWEFYSDFGTKNVTMHYDAGLKDWFNYVSSRGPYPNSCSKLTSSGIELPAVSF
jgi:hypothetical protein